MFHAPRDLSLIVWTHMSPIGWVCEQGSAVSTMENLIQLAILQVNGLPEPVALLLIGTLMLTLANLTRRVRRVTP